MLTVGLTGGIGSGKSTVAKILAELGAPSFDADKVGHEIYLPGGPAYRDVIAAFGNEIVAPDGTIDRKKLGPIVFADPPQLKRLEAIVHPRMFERMREMVAEMRAQRRSRADRDRSRDPDRGRWQPLFDEIWLVIASREKVVRRVERERGLKPEQTEARIKAQLPTRSAASTARWWSTTAGQSSNCAPRSASCGSELVARNNR